MLVRDTEGEHRYVKSSRSGSGNCVEVCRQPPGHIAVRHSKDVERVLRFTADEWSAFVEGVKAGEFDID